MKAIHQCQCNVCQENNTDAVVREHHRMNVFMSRLDEQQRRWYAALEAEKRGYGGTLEVSKITGLHVETIRHGRRELAKDLAGRPVDRIRLSGGGRPCIEKKRPEIKQVLLEEVEDETAGDPKTLKKWVRNSLRNLSCRLERRGFKVSRGTVGRLLRSLHLGLYANRKSISSQQHPDRDLQFRYINKIKHYFMKAGYPVISVDTKKKELVGNFRNAGRDWSQQAQKVNAHDFPSDAKGKAVPYGIYDLVHNKGFVYVGCSADTGEFAVDAIKHWWQKDKESFPHEDKLLILCDSGGSNSYRSRLWKQQLQEKLADALGIEIMVCHYPSGASKWNPIEHRLFSYISMNWAAHPLQTFEDILGFIRHTTTLTGLTVKATLTDKVYKKGIKVTDKVFSSLNIIRRKICPQWNYCIQPHSAMRVKIRF